MAEEKVFLRNVIGAYMAELGRKNDWFLTSISRKRKMKVNEIQEIKCTKTQADYPMLLCGHNGDGVCRNYRCARRKP